MNKTAVIIGSIAVLGIGAFFYFKPKSKGTSTTGTSSVGTSNTGTSTTGTSSVGTSNTGTSSVGTSNTGTSTMGTSNTGTIDIFNIGALGTIDYTLERAKNLATKIKDLRKERDAYIGKPSPFAKIKVSAINMVITKSIAELKSLGYTETDGVIIKIL